MPVTRSTSRILALAVSIGAATLTLALVRPALADDPKFDESLVPLVEEAMARYNDATIYELPPLEKDHWKELLEGKVVRHQWKQPVPGEEAEDSEEEPKQRRRVVALKLIEEPLLKVWLSTLDPHFLGNDKLTEVRLERDEQGGSTWYQYMDLPWPVRNRHWVIRVEKETEVATATSDMAWEQTWNLVEDGEKIAFEVVGEGRAEGVDLGEAEDARYLTANTGAWAMLQIDENLTLLTYQLTVVLGGWIPDRLAAKFAKSALKDLLNTIAENAPGIVEHYDAEHDLIYGGDGKPILAPIEDLPLTEVTSNDPEEDES